MNSIVFEQAFDALTGNPPFPWQRAIYDRFVSDCTDNIPVSCNLPTGLGKTSVIAIWLIALANFPAKMPRRLVYVVNRRTVVDQTTDEVTKIRNNLAKTGMCDRLLGLCAIPLDETDSPLAISTLRGQFADNREWSADPCRPAVICGTVDMIGSRLLFSGYGVGFKAKPLHAGFLGQDVLLVHDEAHLEPAFQKLLVDIEKEQKDGERITDLPWKKLRVMELSATARTGGDVFTLTNEEKSPKLPTDGTPLGIVWKRMTSKKGLKFHGVARSELAKEIGRAALRHRLSGMSILIFVRSIEDVKTVRTVLTDKKAADGVLENQVQVLTGTLRGLERERLVRDDPIFQRLLLKPSLDGRTVYLICTSAGEVGIDISADHMVCDLAPYDSMAQRLGRVNRRGDGASEIDVIYETDPKEKNDDLEKARWMTLEVLQRLPPCNWIADRQEGSPQELSQLMETLREDERKTAFTPLPVMVPTSDILFDSWALTTVREKLPGRPPVELYLHGKAEWEPPQTKVAWREEVWELRPNLEDDRERQRFQKYAADLLEDYPLKAHEILTERSDRLFNTLKKLAAPPEIPVWIVDDQDAVIVTTLGAVVEADREALSYKTVLLPPQAGGLENGLLAASSKIANDVADEWYEDRDKRIRRRARTWDDEDEPAQMRFIRTIDTKPNMDDDADESGAKRYWHWYVRPASADDVGSKSAKLPIRWQDHTDDVTENAQRIAEKLFEKDTEFHTALVLAAKFHDLGKKRVVWQLSIGHRLPENPTEGDWLAKSGGRMKPREITEYRHEFGSLLDIQQKREFIDLKDRPDLQNLILHLIAVHHGYGRPHFPEDKAFDPEPPKGVDPVEIAAQVPQRFARLQRKYGRWGLAYLESLLRAADWAASASPTVLHKEMK